MNTRYSRFTVWLTEVGFFGQQPVRSVVTLVAICLHHLRGNGNGSANAGPFLPLIPDR